ncbi:hypothetical protein [Massilia sp. BKSP1R2A-1]|uniref:hypothetical protein n=1 Tax=Massilia sp. BKSP1R2A-1 TaxID=3422595 RepID=UPI003D33F778
MKFADLLKQNTSSTSTATLTLTSAVAGFRTLTQAMADNELAVGDRTTFIVRDTQGNWEFSLFEIVSPGTLTRIEVRRSSNFGDPEIFLGGATVSNTPDGTWLSELLSAADTVEVTDLQSLTSIADAVRFLALDTAGGLRTVTAAVQKAYNGGSSAPADTTVPSAPTNLASNTVTQTSFNVTFTPGTDNVGVARSEWSLNGTTWTAIGSATTFSVTGRTAGTLYSVQIRTVDTSGNVSAVATINVTTAQPTSTPDTQSPTWLAGSLSTSSVNSSGYVMTWPTATDNVGVDHYESSIDGGVTWTAHAANVTSRTVTGRPASTTDDLRVRAHDAAGNISNVLTATVTTSAAQPTTPTLSKAGAVRATGAATGVANVNTDVSSGELRILLSANASESDTTVAASSTAQPVTAAGTQRINLAGIAGTTLYMHVVHRVNGVNSAVVSTPLYQYAPRSNTAPKTTILPSTGTASGSDMYYSGSDYFTGTYYDITPTPPSTPLGGWDTTATGAETIIAAAENNAGGGKKNGLAPLTAATAPAWNMIQVLLWQKPAGVRSGPLFYKLKIGDAPAVCLMPKDGNGEFIPAYIEATG